MRMRDFRRAILLGCAVVAFASCDALVGISDTSVAHGGSAGAAGAASVDASSEDVAIDSIADAPNDHSVGPLPSHGLGCALWPGNVPVTVGCPSGQVITGFQTALYGTPTGSCSGDAGVDGGGSFQPGSCNAPDAQSALEKLCDGLSSCTFTADANLTAFGPDGGDPCPGTSKFVAVRVQCGAQPPPDAGGDAGSATLPMAGQILDLDANKFTSAAIGASLPNKVWNDASANQLNASVPNGVTPPTIGRDQTSGLGLVHFSGTNEYLTLPSITANLSNGLTAFAVVAPDNLEGWQRLFDLGSGGPQDNVVWTEDVASRTLGFHIWHGNQGEEYASAPDIFDTNELELFALRAAPSGSLLKVTIYKGGAPVYEQFMAPPSNVTRTSNLIGKSNWSGNALYQGYIGQLVIYNRGLSDAEMTGASQALLSKWKLCTTTNLQSDPANCGECGHLCVPGQQCQAGVCTGPLLSNCTSLAVGGSGAQYALCHNGNAKVSWVQARNACVDLGGDLVSLTSQQTSNAVAAGGSALIGLTDYGTNSFYWSDGNGASFHAWSGDGGIPPTTQERCAEVTPGNGGNSVWQTVSCTAAGTTPWLCKLPESVTGCDSWLDPATQRAYAICNGTFPSDEVRRDVCTHLVINSKPFQGTLLAVQKQTEAVNLGALLTRYGANLPAAALDLTDGATPPTWTLHNGAAPPFVDWLSGEPQVGNEPRCATLTTSGQMATAPCDAAEPVICSLPKGTKPDETLTPMQPSAPLFVFGFPPRTASLYLGSNGNEANAGAATAIPAKIQVTCSPFPGEPPTGGTEPVLLSFSPGFNRWHECVMVAFHCDGLTNQNTAVTSVPIQTPPIAGVFTVGIQASADSSCTQTIGPPQPFGAVAVTP